MMNQNTTLDRRSLLKLISASPLLFGMSGLLMAQDPQPKGQGKQGRQGKQPTPTWFKEALRQAQKRNVPVVAFVSPDLGQKEAPTPELRRQRKAFKQRLADLYNAAPVKGAGGKGVQCTASSWFTINFDDRMARMAVYMQMLLDSQNPDLQELLLDSVWVCAPAEVLGCEQSETVVTLDAKGRRTGGAMVNISDEKDVAQKLRHLVFGNGKLRKRAKAASTNAVTTAFHKLTGKGETGQREAREYLLANLDTVLPAVIEARQHHQDGGLRRQLAGVIATACEQARKKDYGGLLPFGAKIEKCSVYDPCPPCGMAIVAAGSRKMLKLLGK